MKKSKLTLQQKIEIKIERDTNRIFEGNVSKRSPNSERFLASMCKSTKLELLGVASVVTKVSQDFNNALISNDQLRFLQIPETGMIFWRFERLRRQLETLQKVVRNYVRNKYGKE